MSAVLAFPSLPVTPLPVGAPIAANAHGTSDAPAAALADLFSAALGHVLSDAGVAPTPTPAAAAGDDRVPADAVTDAAADMPAVPLAAMDDAALVVTAPAPKPVAAQDDEEHADDLPPAAVPALAQPLLGVPVVISAVVPAAPARVDETPPVPADVLPAPMTKTAPTPQAAPAVPMATTAKAAQNDAAPASNTLATAVRDAVAPFSLGDAGAAQAADVPLKLPNGEPTQWRQPLQQALGERLQWTSTRTSDTAVIRLDPPQMGQIEIAIRHEAGALKVSISATHGEVLRQLQGVGDNLRHDLSQRHAGEVSVQVSEVTTARFGQADADARRQRQGQGEAGDGTPTRAFGDDDGEQHAFGMGRDEERTA
ncbi:MAG: flagellar hook-length control protein FliK [Rhodocyclaceae bacterium]